MRFRGRERSSQKGDTEGIFERSGTTAKDKNGLADQVRGGRRAREQLNSSVHSFM